MARKRHSDEDCLKLLREIELQLAAGSDVPSACRAAGISDATYYNWRKKLKKGMKAHFLFIENEFAVLVEQLAINQNFAVCAHIADHIPVDGAFVFRTGFGVV